MTASKRRAPIKARQTREGLAHLDLENLVVALFVERPDGWPNALYQLGYRLTHFDAQINLLDGAGARLVKGLRPDAIGHHRGRNLALVIECKTGSDVGLHQIPEGRPESRDQWAAAVDMPRGGLNTPEVRGVLVAEPSCLGPRLGDIERAGATWLRVESGFPLAPNSLPDDRIDGALAGLPSEPWPRSYVPYWHDTSAAEDLERVVATIGPLILEAAYRGDVFVAADDIARKTHAAVWNLTDKTRHVGWTTAASRALDELAKGKLRPHATYDPTLRRMKLLAVRPGVGVDGRTLAAMRAAISSGHRKLQRRAKQVRSSSPGALQTTLFSDDEI